MFEFVKVGKIDLIFVEIRLFIDVMKIFDDLCKGDVFGWVVLVF